MNQEIKNLIFRILSVVWWIFFGICFYGIFRTISAESGFESVKRALLVSGVGVLICGIPLLLRKYKIFISYLTGWKYCKWILVYAFIWYGAIEYLYFRDTLPFWSDFSLSHYLWDIVILGCYLIAWFSSLVIMIVSFIYAAVLLFSEPKD